MEWGKSVHEEDKKISPELKDMSFPIRKIQQAPSSMNENITTSVHFIGKLKKGERIWRVGIVFHTAKEKQGTYKALGI